MSFKRSVKFAIMELRGSSIVVSVTVNREMNAKEQGQNPLLSGFPPLLGP